MKRFLEYVNQWYYDRSFYLNNIYYYQIHITKRCQNSCAHCYYKEIGGSKADVDINFLIEAIKKIADNAHKLSLSPRIDFTGGDPFLYPNLAIAIQACRDNGVKYGFKCNPDFFLKANTEDIYSLIHDCADISISVDGLQESHDGWRGEGNFNKTIKAAGRIKELNFQLRINSTLSLDNLQNLIPLIEFLISERLVIDDYTWARYWSRINREKIIPAYLLPQIFDEYTEYLIQLFESASFYRHDNEDKLKPQVFFGFKEHQWFPYFATKGYISDEVYKKVIRSKNCLNCTATKHIYIMDPDTTVYRCRKIEESAGNYLDGFVEECQFTLDKTCLCTKCIYYNCCGGCSAMALSFTDDYNSIEPGCMFFKSI